MKNKAKQIYPKLDLGMSKGYPFVMAFAFQMDGIRVYTGSWININNYCLKNGILCHAKVIYYNALDHESKKVEKYEILGNDLSNVNRESSFLLRWGSNKSFIKEQKWKAFQKKILRFQDVYDWGTALLTALVILLLIIVLINIIIPV